MRRCYGKPRRGRTILAHRACRTRPQIGAAVRHQGSSRFPVKSAQHGEHGGRLGPLAVIRVDERVADHPLAVDDVGCTQGQLARIVAIVLGEVETPLGLLDDDFGDLVGHTNRRARPCLPLSQSTSNSR